MLGDAKIFPLKRSALCGLPYQLSYDFHNEQTFDFNLFKVNQTYCDPTQI